MLNICILYITWCVYVALLMVQNTSDYYYPACASKWQSRILSWLMLYMYEY